MPKFRGLAHSIKASRIGAAYFSNDLRIPRIYCSKRKSKKQNDSTANTAALNRDPTGSACKNYLSARVRRSLLVQKILTDGRDERSWTASSVPRNSGAASDFAARVEAGSPPSRSRHVPHGRAVPPPRLPTSPPPTTKPAKSALSSSSTRKNPHIQRLLFPFGCSSAPKNLGARLALRPASSSLSTKSRSV